MTNIGIIIGTDRENRVTSQVAEYILKEAQGLGLEDTQFELIDIADYDLPLFNEPAPPAALEEYSSPNIARWGEKIGAMDGFIFVTPEYNKGIPAALKSAIDQLGINAEWNNKAAGIVSHGSTLGISSAITLRLVLTQFNMAVLGTQGAFDMFTDFSDGQFTPKDVHQGTVHNLIKGVSDWARALKTIR